jgi:propionyl-CoA synthetase
MPRTEGRDVDYAELRSQHMNSNVPVQWLESNEPSYILYTSRTTGKPKGVQRDTGGYAVALAASMKYIYCCNPGETYFSTSDIGWVVGHSYIVYAPLINGSATVVYEGLPIRPDPGVWWKIVEDYKVTTMFSAPTAVRVLKKQDPAYLKEYDVSTLRSCASPETTRRADCPLDSRRIGSGYHRLLANRNGLAIIERCARGAEVAAQIRVPEFCGLRL